jgi:polyisoprenoid-binding protein YceI
LKTFLPLVLFLVLSPMHLGTQADSKPLTRYSIDVSDSHIEFSVSSALDEVSGSFKSWHGDLKLPTRGVITDAQFTLEVSAASMTTGNRAKDEILKSEKFFYVDKFPSISFVSTKALPLTDPTKFLFQGDFTLHGVTKPVTLQVTLDLQGKTRGQIYADLSFDRRDFGMTHDIPFTRVSDTVRVRIDLAVERAPLSSSQSGTYSSIPSVSL